MNQIVDIDIPVSLHLRLLKIAESESVPMKVLLERILSQWVDGRTATTWPRPTEKRGHQ